MPIKSTSWTVGDKVFATLHEAQVEELLNLVDGARIDPTNTGTLVAGLVTQKEEVIRILSVKEKRQRSDKGKRHRNSALKLQEQ